MADANICWASVFLSLLLFSSFSPHKKKIYRQACVRIITRAVRYILPIKSSLLCNGGRMGDRDQRRISFTPSFPEFTSIASCWMLVLDNVLILKMGKRGKKKKERESGALLESASWLQNETSKTNTGLKLDFPKHCIPSHFTHHRGLWTRIDMRRKICRRSRGRRARRNISKRKKGRKKNAIHHFLMKCKGPNPFICGMLRNCPAYVDFPSIRREF